MLFQIKVVDPPFGKHLGIAYRAGLIDDETVIEAFIALRLGKKLTGEPWREKELQGKLAGKRSIRLGEDLRLIFKRTKKTIVIYDIGTHGQLYMGEPRKWWRGRLD